MLGNSALSDIIVVLLTQRWVTTSTLQETARNAVLFLMIIAQKNGNDVNLPFNNNLYLTPAKC